MAGVGYSDLRDLSFGPRLVDRMRELSWPEQVEIHDLSYGPMAVVQWLEDLPGRFHEAIFAGAVERGRTPGTLWRYPWVAPLLDTDAIQARVAEAVTGVIGLDNLLIIAGYFGVLPARTSVVELEPTFLEWGDELSADAAKGVGEALDWIRRTVEETVARPGNGRPNVDVTGSTFH